MPSPAAQHTNVPEGVEIRGKITKEYADILTPEALTFITELNRKFRPGRNALLHARAERQARFDTGERPDFLQETKQIRESDWQVAPIPADLQDRRVEITGPVERKMIINALNAPVKVFMADCEDSLTPSWERLMDGQVNLRDAVNKTITFTSPEGKKYQLNDKTAALIVRPRGWHLDESHIDIDGQPAVGALVDFGLYFFHNHKALLDQGSGPYFYIPKLENHKEARLWNEVFVWAQEQVGLPVGTIKATVLIEVITAAFEMDEILYELRDHIVGLNAGRWDYIFSVIKKFHKDAHFVMPDRGQVTMTKHFLRHYSLLLIRTCHRRGAFAMGGMAAFIPIKDDPAANETALNNVRADKEREVTDGHDGTWVAHPGLAPVASEIFDKHMPLPNQVGNLREDVKVTAEDLLKVPAGSITEAGLRNNISVSLQYTACWLAGLGCVPLYNLMEDAATAEIARSQLWQWIHHQAVMDSGETVTLDLVRRMLEGEHHRISKLDTGLPFTDAELEKAEQILLEIIGDKDFTPFLTEVAYRHL